MSLNCDVHSSSVSGEMVFVGGMPSLCVCVVLIVSMCITALVVVPVVG